MYGKIYKYAAIYINTLCNIYIRKKNIVLTHTAPHIHVLDCRCEVLYFRVLYRALNSAMYDVADFISFCFNA